MMPGDEAYPAEPRAHVADDLRSVAVRARLELHQEVESPLTNNGCCLRMEGWESGHTTDPLLSGPEAFRTEQTLTNAVNKEYTLALSSVNQPLSQGASQSANQSIS